MYGTCRALEVLDECPRFSIVDHCRHLTVALEGCGRNEHECANRDQASESESDSKCVDTRFRKVPFGGPARSVKGHRAKVFREPLIHPDRRVWCDKIEILVERFVEECSVVSPG